MKLSENEKKVYDYVKERIEDGYAPSIREICSEFGFRSTSTAHRYINSLKEKGLLEKGENLNRALKLTGARQTLVPVLGTVTAGQPITAVEDITGYISLVPNKTYSYPLFALKVRGDSMINAAITDGDIVIAEQVPVVANGKIAVCLVDGESATVKRFYKENGGYRLQPENDTMEPIYVREAVILGRVVALLRSYV